MMNVSSLELARNLYREGRRDESRAMLRALLLEQPELINLLAGLARTSQDPREAMAAADLAQALAPENELVQRAVADASRLVPPPAPLDVTRVTGLTVAQARAVNWPFKGLNRPVGVLMDEGLVALSDLGYGLEKAYDPLVKKAAATLLLAALLKDGLTDPLPPLRVLGQNRYAPWLVRRSAFYLGLLTVPMLAVSGAVIGLGIGWAYYLSGLKTS